MKYEALIRHINGDVITSISDDNKKRFKKELKKASKNLSEYIGKCNDGFYRNSDLIMVEV